MNLKRKFKNRRNKIKFVTTIDHESESLFFTFRFAAFRLLPQINDDDVDEAERMQLRGIL